MQRTEITFIKKDYGINGINGKKREILSTYIKSIVCAFLSVFSIKSVAMDKLRYNMD